MFKDLIEKQLIEKSNRQSLLAHTQVNLVIEEIYQSGFVKDENNKTYSHDVASVTFQAGSILYDLIRQLKPSYTIEIGMAYGLSTLFICQALQDNGKGHHIAIDPLQDELYQSIGLLNIARANLSARLTFYQAGSEEILPQLVAQEKIVDFAFIDGNHLFDNAFIDFFYIDRLLQTQGYLAIDDIWMLGVRKVASFIQKNKPYQLVRPPDSVKTPLGLWGLRLGRRFLQNPLGQDWKLKLIPENIALFKKLDADKREWDFHREF